MSKIKKIMLKASGVDLTIEMNAEKTVFITVGQGLIVEAVELSDISLAHYVAEDALSVDSYSMMVDSTNYHLTQDNLKIVSIFLGRHIEKVI